MRKNVRHFTELLVSMTERELRARYKFTIFGFLWITINPVLQMLIIGFVFTFFIKQPIEHYYFYLFGGLLVWNFFTTSLNKATPSIVFERSLIKKAKFPHAVIPLSIVLSNFIHLIVAMILYLIPLIFIHTLSLSKLPYLIAAYGFLILFTTGLSLLTSALNVQYRDINFFVQAILVIWFYGTPIIYSFSLIPRSLIWLWRLNPMTSIIQLFQYALVNAPSPGPAMLASNIAVILIVTALGILIFRDQSKNFDDWL